MRLDQNFALEVQSGTVTVGQAGVYYIYAQVNYLDENDVNAFQVGTMSGAIFCLSPHHPPLNI